MNTRQLKIEPYINNIESNVYKVCEKHWYGWKTLSIWHILSYAIKEHNELIKLPQYKNNKPIEL